MWIVNLALRRPYAFIVLGVFILIAGVLSILSTPKDIFPSINIPVISVIWTYTGMAPKDIADNITSPYERALTTTVDNIEHIESESLYGIAIVKIFLQPHASVPQGVAQVHQFLRLFSNSFRLGSHRHWCSATVPATCRC
jgi:multidrug efflux pump subunit AcrB